MNFIFFHITAASYLIATVIYIIYLFSHNNKVVATANKILIISFLFHSITIITRGIEAGHFPFTNLHESLSIFSWMIAGIYLFVNARYHIAALGSFVSPLALLLLITASLLPKEIVPLVPQLESYWLYIHVPLAILGNAFFALSFLFGIMYLIQEHYLKSKKVGGLYFLLPSLDVLDELGYRFLTYGFPLLTIAMITGAVWSEYVWGSYWSWQPRQIWSLITWFLYAALLHGRLTVGWRGRKAAIYAIIGFMVLLGSFLIINLLSLGKHGFLR